MARGPNRSHQSTSPAKVPSKSSSAETRAKPLSTASGLQRIGAPPHIISTVLGHAREAGATQTDAAYAHDRRVDEHRLWLERWARHVEAVVTRERKGADVVPIRA